MNPEIFIRKQVAAGFGGDKAAISEVLDETVDRYRKDIFDNVMSLIKEMRRKLGQGFI